MKQGTDLWLEWRSKGLGASDAPIIMKVSPWKTPYGLWEEKTGRTKPSPMNWAMQRGVDLEPKARAHYELMRDLEMPADLAEHPQYSFLRASLDGYNANAKRILEIKCAGEKDHKLALEGKVPEKYIPQVQHQLLVTGADVLDYFSFDGERGAIVEVTPDKSYQSRLFEEESKFWDLVQSDTPPELTDKDFAELDDEESVKLFLSWREAERIEKEATKRLKEIEDQIKGKYAQPRIRCQDTTLVRTTRKGTIDYAKIPELKNVDLEQYRKAAISVTTIKASKK